MFDNSGIYKSKAALQPEGPLISVSASNPDTVSLEAKEYVCAKDEAQT